MNALGSVVDAVRAPTVGLSSMAKRGWNETATNAGSAARVLGDHAVLFVKHAVEAPGFIAKVASRDEETMQFLWHWWSGAVPDTAPVSTEPTAPVRLSSAASRWLSNRYAIDEIGPLQFDPSNNMFLAHLYLLMLFIVSFPGSYRTKSVVRKHNDDEVDSSGSSAESTPIHSFATPRGARATWCQATQPRAGRGSQSADLTFDASAPLQKKSLSYFL